MSIQEIIDKALQEEAERQEAAKQKSEAGAREKERRKERQAVIFTTCVIPALEETRKLLTGKGIECSLTNGEAPATGQRRHGITMRWRSNHHVLVFTASDRDESISATAEFSVREQSTLRDAPYNCTLGDAESLVALFLEKAFARPTATGF
ncbi:MAG: hypothetical protein V4726_07130 [Verrucomicrobiota bacterium]